MSGLMLHKEPWLVVAGAGDVRILLPIYFVNGSEVFWPRVVTQKSMTVEWLEIRDDDGDDEALT